MKPSPEVLIVGGGVTALLAASYAASLGADVVNVRPYMDVDALPRPLPPTAHPEWRRLLQFLGLGLQLNEFGGRTNDVIHRRRLADQHAGRWIEPERGAFVVRRSDPEWAWSEPEDWPLFMDLLSKHVKQRCVATIQLKFPLHWCFRKRHVGILGVPGWFPKALRISLRDWQVGVPAPVLPRCGVQGRWSWWSDRSCRVLHCSGPTEGRPISPPVDQYVSIRGFVSTTPEWGVVPRPGLSLLELPSPAAESPSVWFTGLFSAINDLFD